MKGLEYRHRDKVRDKGNSSVADNSNVEAVLCRVQVHGNREDREHRMFLSKGNVAISRDRVVTDDYVA